MLRSILEVHFQTGLELNCGFALALISSRRMSSQHELHVGCSLGMSVLSLTLLKMEGSALRTAISRATAANLEALPEFLFVLSHVLPCYNSCLLAFHFLKSTA